MQPFNPKRALLSVSNQYGIIDLARTLHAHHIELIATNSTAALLRQACLPVTEASDCIQFLEVINNHIKTLHPVTHASTSANQIDKQALAVDDSKLFDILVVNLYPFEQVIGNLSPNFYEAIKDIDSDRPAIVRAAAKNYDTIVVIVNPSDYAQLSQYVTAQHIIDSWRFNLAKKAFAYTVAYDAAISNYLETLDVDKKPYGFPATLTYQFHKQYDLSYGENPHQQAILYRDNNPLSNALAMATILQGPTLSYSNLVDAEVAFNCIKSFSLDKPCCVIVKHGNPCGIAIAENQYQAYLSAYQSNPTSSYGVMVAFNQPLQQQTAQALLTNQWVDVVIAPVIEKAVCDILALKLNLSLLITGHIDEKTQFKLDMRGIDGGLLVQEYDYFPIWINDFTVVTIKKPSNLQKNDLLFAWHIVKHVKSSAIVLAKNTTTIGIGAAQTNCVMSARIALWQAQLAGFSPHGAVMASDAFLPFIDSLDLVVAAGITAIIQPGGSSRDSDIITAANTAGISMIFTGTRHFRH